MNGLLNTLNAASEEPCGIDKLMLWIVNHPAYLECAFNDNCGSASFATIDDDFLKDSAEAARAAGFAVTANEAAWTAEEPTWPGRCRQGQWHAVRCTPKTNGRHHDTFELVYYRQNIETKFGSERGI